MNITKFQCRTISSKYIVLLILGIMTNVFAINLTAQQCTFCSQADIDAYNDSYGTAFFGNMYISGPDITNLDSLYNLHIIINLGVEGNLKIYDNPLLENTDGLSSFQVSGGQGFQIAIYNNPKLKRINLPSVAQAIDSISNNVSLDSIIMRGVPVNIMNNDSLSYFEITESSYNSDFTLYGNPLLEEIAFSPTVSSISDGSINGSAIKNLDGFSNLTSIESLTLTNNANLQFYCGLNGVLQNDINTPITLSGNYLNPTNEDILAEGTCGIFVRNSVGYNTLPEALAGAHDHSVIYLTKDYLIDTTTLFSSGLHRTLFIHPNTALTFDAPFTNEGIVINHGTLEILTGSLFTNSGAFVNTGLLITN